jgi:hypothetical protein
VEEKKRQPLLWVWKKKGSQAGGDVRVLKEIKKKKSLLWLCLGVEEKKGSQAGGDVRVLKEIKKKRQPLFWFCIYSAEKF